MLLKTLSTIDRPAFSGLERNFSFITAVRAYYLIYLPRPVAVSLIQLFHLLLNIRMLAFPSEKQAVQATALKPPFKV